MDSLITRVLSIQSQRAQTYTGLDNDLHEFLSGNTDIDLNLSCSKALHSFKALSDEIRGIESECTQASFTDLANTIRAIQNEERTRLHTVVGYIKLQLATLQSFESCDHGHTHTDGGVCSHPLPSDTPSIANEATQSLPSPPLSSTVKPSFHLNEHDWKRMMFEFYAKEDEEGIDSDADPLGAQMLGSRQSGDSSGTTTTTTQQITDDSVSEAFRKIELNAAQRQRDVRSRIQQQKLQHSEVIDSIDSELNDLVDSLRCMLLDCITVPGDPHSE